jgi:outer membrane protein assembly factor BamB
MDPRLRRLFFASVFVIAILPRIHGEDWPQFRGPTGQGISAETGLAVEWDATKNVRWRLPVPGKGWSSPIVWRGRVYLTTAVPAGDGEDQSLRALCVDAAAGALLWDTEVFLQKASAAMRIHSKNSHSSPTPLTEGERLYVHFGTNGTAALDLQGKVVWRTNELRYAPVHGSGGSPALAGECLVVSCDGSDEQFVAALDRRTGRLRWRTPRFRVDGKRFAFSTPLAIEVEGQTEVVSAAAGGVAAYDLGDGRELWRVRYEGYSVVPRPVFGHGLLFISTGYDEPSLIAVRPGGRGDATETHVVWKLSTGAPLNPSPLLAGDELYIVSDAGVASCLDARSGKVHWRERVGGNHSASPLFAGGKIYFQSEQGVGTVVRAARTFERIGRNDLGERTLASYAASGGAIFIRTETQLLCIRPGT